MQPLTTVGPYQLYAVETGMFALDGGAMFGVVPKPLWEKRYPCDERNRIHLAARAVLLVGDSRNILIDVGLGDKWQSKEIDIYAIDQSKATLEKSLTAYGIVPDDITDVVLTHLHFDHTGGSTKIVDGKCIPRFKNARYHVQEENWRHANNPTLRDRASYLKPDFEALQQFDQLVLHRSPRAFDHDEEILPNLQAIVCHGHTFGLQMIKLVDKKQTILYCADMIPTAAHFPVPWVMAYDLQPLVSIEEKAKIHAHCKSQGWKLFFEHDARNALFTPTFES